MKEKVRIEWIDVFKGLAILLVVIGHLNTGKVTHNFIYSFHLPAFIFISGVFYKKRAGWKEIFRKDIKKLGILFLFFVLLWLAFDFVYQFAIAKTTGVKMMGLPEYALRALGAIILGNANITEVSFGAIWYLVMLIMVRAMYNFADKLTERKNWLLHIVTVVMFAAGVSLLNGVYVLPYYLSSAMTMMVFFHLGRITKPWLMKAEEAKGYLLAGISIFTAALLFMSTLYTGDANFGNNIYEFPPAVLPNALLGIAALVCLSVLISRIAFLKKIVAYYGKNSLSVMGWHSEIRIGVLFVCSLINTESHIIEFIAVVLATLLLTIPLNKLTEVINNLTNDKRSVFNG